MKRQVAFVMCGHSEYDNDLWHWLGRRAKAFDIPSRPGIYSDDREGFDFCTAFPLFMMAGCEVSVSFDEDAEAAGYPRENPNFHVEFDGSIKELISRLNELFPIGDERALPFG